MKPRPQSGQPRIRSVLATSLFALGLAATSAAKADGTENIGAPSIDIAAGSSVYSAGVGLDSGSGDINVNLPAGADVNQVLLYWSSRGSVVRDTLLVDGVPVTGAVIGGPSPGFPTSSAQGPARSYRADITGLGLVPDGSSVLSVSGDELQGALEGASVVVIYDDHIVNRFGGYAFAVGAPKIGPLDASVGFTGFQKPSGDDLYVKTADVKVPFLPLRVTAIESQTTGAGGASVSTTELAGVKIGPNALDPLGSSLRLGVIRSRAVAACAVGGGVDLDGSSIILGAEGTIQGNTPSFEGKLSPNTTILNLAGLIKIVANEQVVEETANAGKITVTALHITSPLKILTKDVDVRIGEASASIRCGDELPASAISIADGSDFAFNGAPYSKKLRNTVSEVFAIAPVPFDRTAKLHLLVGDAEAGRPDVVKVTTDTGVSETYVDQLNSSEGFEWDDDTYSVSIPAGTTKLTVRLFSKRGAGSELPADVSVDSMQWVAAILSVPTVEVGNLYSGQATVVKADVNLGPLLQVNAAVADTGALPESGGVLVASTANADVPSLLTSGTARARTAGAGNGAGSDAIVEDLDVTLGAELFGQPFGLNISADVLGSNSSATCDANNVASVSGSSTIANLVINGQVIPIESPTPIVIDLVIAQVYINEQIIDSSGANNGSITVNALRVVVPDPTGTLGTDVVNLAVASSHSDITCY